MSSKVIYTFFLNDNRYTDSELYEGFDEEGHRIIWLSVKLDLVQVDCTATSQYVVFAQWARNRPVGYVREGALATTTPD